MVQYIDKYYQHTPSETELTVSEMVSNSELGFLDYGVEIDGFLFFPDEVKSDNLPSREFIRTKIMSGGEYVSRGQYLPKEFNFSTTLDLNPLKPYEYDDVFLTLMNKSCKIMSPYMGDMFNGEVKISKVHPQSSPHSLKIDVKIKEIPPVDKRVRGDDIIIYPSTKTPNPNGIDWKEVYTNPQTSESDESERDPRKFHTPDGEEATMNNNPYGGSQ